MISNLGNPFLLLEKSISSAEFINVDINFQFLDSEIGVVSCRSMLCPERILYRISENILIAYSKDV